MMIRSELREQAITRSGGRCEWPRCVERGDELAHLHSVGAGGRASADVLSNVAWLCWDHARMSDGLHTPGGAAAYRRAHLDLLGDRFLEMPVNTIAWERAEALACVVSGRSIQSGAGGTG